MRRGDWDKERNRLCCIWGEAKFRAASAHAATASAKVGLDHADGMGCGAFWRSLTASASKRLLGGVRLFVAPGIMRINAHTERKW